MEKKEKILFIINPVAGTRSKKRIPELIGKTIDFKRFDVEIITSLYAGHASALAAEGARQKIKYIVAVGGDGTMNEVARAILNTDAVLGIIPFGSGNGLARHLGIPLDSAKAIGLLNNAKTQRMDAGEIEGRPFFCTAGIGFDAHIGKLFDDADTRGLYTYAKTTIAEFMSYKPVEYLLDIEGQRITTKAFLVTFANASQYGNNAFIAPQANIHDGFLNLCILKPFPAMSVLKIALDVFLKKVDRNPYMQTQPVKNASVQLPTSGWAHLDGEPFEIGDTVNVKILPDCLNVAVPVD